MFGFIPLPKHVDEPLGLRYIASIDYTSQRESFRISSMLKSIHITLNAHQKKASWGAPLGGIFVQHVAAQSALKAVDTRQDPTRRIPLCWCDS